MDLIAKHNDFQHKDFKYFIIDTDVGGDDAQALLLGFHFAKKYNKTLLGITCVDGNAFLEDVITNTLITEAVADVQVPVYPGSTQSIMYSFEKDYYFSKDGLGGKQAQLLEELKLKGKQIKRHLVEKTPAYKFIAESAMKYKGEVALITLGPLTNLALAYHYQNEIVNCFQMISVMGGSDNLVGMSEYFSAEFNFSLDAEACNIVFGAFKNITIITIGTSIMNIKQDAVFELFTEESTEKGKFISRIYNNIKSTHKPWLCDPLSLFPLFRPQIIECGIDAELKIHYKGKRVHGAMMIQWFGEKEKKNCYIIRNFKIEQLVKDIKESYQ